MLIGEVAEATGTTTKTLRFYEREGLLPEPARTPAGYRDYDPAITDRIRFIRDAQSAGFTLRQVGQVLEVRDAGEAPCDHVRDLVEDRLAEVEQRLRELRAVRSQLMTLRERARAVDAATCEGYCSIVEGPTP